MGPGPMESSAAAALEMRDELCAAGQLEDLAFVEIDVVYAFRKLMRDGSPKLRQALVNAALDHAPRN